MLSTLHLKVRLASSIRSSSSSSLSFESSISPQLLIVNGFIGNGDTGVWAPLFQSSSTTSRHQCCVGASPTTTQQVRVLSVKIVETNVIIRTTSNLVNRNGDSSADSLPSFPDANSVLRRYLPNHISTSAFMTLDLGPS